MKSYLDIVERVLSEGEIKSTRQGTDAHTIAGAMFEHDMSNGFPLLTTKKMPFKIIGAELEFFIKGITDKQWLLDHAKIINYDTSTCNTDKRFMHFSKKYNIKEACLENGDILLVFSGFLCTGSSACQLFENTKKMVKDNLTSEQILLSVKQKANIDKHISSGAGVCIIRSINNKKTVIHACFQNEVILNSLN